MDFVEQRNGHAERDEVVAPDPLVLEVVLDRELGQLRREGVRELHGTCHRVRHFAAADAAGAFWGGDKRRVRRCQAGQGEQKGVRLDLWAVRFRRGLRKPPRDRTDRSVKASYCYVMLS